MYLPIVSDDTCSNVDHRLATDEFFLHHNTQKLLKEQPIIAKFIGEFVLNLPECCSHAAMLAAYITYNLLESQAEADKMNEEIKL